MLAGRLHCDDIRPKILANSDVRCPPRPGDRIHSDIVLLPRRLANLMIIVHIDRDLGEGWSSSSAIAADNVVVDGHHLSEIGGARA